MPTLDNRPIYVDLGVEDGNPYLHALVGRRSTTKMKKNQVFKSEKSIDRYKICLGDDMEMA